MKPIPWSERQLPVGKGPEEWPVLLERMQGTPHRLAVLFRHQPIERLVLRMQEGWSPLEHVAHLLHLDQRFQERVDDFVQRRPRLCAIELHDQERVLRSQRERMPGDLIEEFRLSRLHLVRRLRALDDAVLRHRAAHPCRGIAMGPVDMALWIAEHDDHHLATVRARLGAFDA